MRMQHAAAVALIAMAYIAIVVVAFGGPEANDTDQCAADAGLMVDADGYWNIAGMTNDEWGQAYRTVLDCTHPTVTVYEDGSFVGCIPGAACND